MDVNDHIVCTDGPFEGVSAIIIAIIDHNIIDIEIEECNPRYGKITISRFQM